MQLAQVGNLAGSFTQTAQATAYSELDFGSEVLDAIHMTGAAVLGGVADVSLLNPQLVKPGHFQKSLFSADMGVTDAGMVLRTAPSVVIVYDVIYPNGLNAVLDYNVDFSPIGPGGAPLAQQSFEPVAPEGVLEVAGAGGDGCGGGNDQGRTGWGGPGG